VIVPQAIPEHPIPETLHITISLWGPLAENWICPPGFTWGDIGEIVRVDRAAAMVTIAVDERLGAATEVAVIVTFESGTVDGATYRPDEEMEPHADPAHPVPAMDHRTDMFVVPVTVAVNCFCPPTVNCVLEGETRTETAVAASMTTVADADFVGAATDVAVTVARAEMGRTAGAV